MKNILNILFIWLIAVSCQGSDLGAQGTTPPSHQIWNALVNKHVSEDGKVDYKGFIQDKAELEKYLDLLSASPPDKSTWSEKEQLAYWINAYNAFTVKLIVDNYPVESIQDLHPTVHIPGVNTVWHKKFFQIGGKDASLDEIEHKILRKQFSEPRIHFAINCASLSCPILLNEAYTAEKLDQQLNKQGVRFINDPGKNKISPDNIVISKIFSWFTGDFTKNGTLIDFLNKYSKVKINSNAKVTYMPYDWSLNE